MDIEAKIADLGRHWDQAGFLGLLRDGRLDMQGVADFLQSIESTTNAQVRQDYRLVPLLWYVPVFLEYQLERMAERDDQAADAAVVREVRNAVIRMLEDVLGLP